MPGGRCNLQVRTSAGCMRSECGAPGLRCRCGERASLSRRRLGQGVVVVSERAQAQPRTGLRLGDIARLVVVWLVSSAALAVAGALLPDLTAVAPWAYLVATAVAGLLGLAFRPVVVRVVARIGWLAVVFAGLVGQALVVYAAIWIAPGITATFWSAFWASWIVAAIGTAAPGWAAPALMTRSRLRCCGAGWPANPSPTRKSTALCSFSWTASPFPSSGGPSRRVGSRPCGAGSPRVTMCSESGRHSCRALRLPVSSGFCMARSAGVRPFAGTTVTWVES